MSGQVEGRMSFYKVSGPAVVCGADGTGAEAAAPVGAALGPGELAAERPRGSAAVSASSPCGGGCPEVTARFWPVVSRIAVLPRRLHCSLISFVKWKSCFSSFLIVSIALASIDLTFYFNQSKTKGPQTKGYTLFCQIL